MIHRFIKKIINKILGIQSPSREYYFDFCKKNADSITIGLGENNPP